MRHRSWCAENPGHESNERLEFLGDAVLGLVVTTHLFRTYPGFPEGELAKVRAAVVSSVSLAEIAREIGLGDHLLLGKGENLSGGREKRSILADAVEAVIGASYLDGGWEVAQSLIMRLVGERIVLAAAGPGGHDYKTRLQEFAARMLDRVPRYDIEDHGPDHAKRFVAAVSVGGELLGTGEGHSKKQAEQAAAEVAWNRLQVRDDIVTSPLVASSTTSNAPTDEPTASAVVPQTDEPAKEVMAAAPVSPPDRALSATNPVDDDVSTDVPVTAAEDGA